MANPCSSFYSFFPSLISSIASQANFIRFPSFIYGSVSLRHASKIECNQLSGRRPFLFSSLSAFFNNITNNKLLKTKTKSSFLYVMLAVVLIFTYTLKKEEENVSAEAFGVLGRFRRLAATLFTRKAEVSLLRAP